MINQIIALFVLVIASFFFGKHWEHQNSLEVVAKLNDQARVVEKQHTEVVNQYAIKLEKANDEANATIEKLRADIRNGNRRLSIPIEIPAATNTAIATGNQETRAFIDPAVADDLVAIAAEGDTAIRQLNACIDLYNQFRQ